MIKEALEYLAKLAVGEKGFHALPVIPNEHVSRVLINGKVEMFGHDPAPITATVHDINSVRTAVDRFAIKAGKATIWIRSSEVLIVLDGELGDFRDDRVKFVPGLHPVVAVFEAMQQTKYTHDGLLNLLRYDLHDTTFDESFSLAIRNMKISIEQEEGREQTRTSDAMGKSVRAQVSGEKPLPETVIFEFPAYPGLPELEHKSLTITCSVQAIPLEKMFKVSPLTGEMDRIKREAAQALAAVIRKTVPEATVLLGDTR